MRIVAPGEERVGGPADGILDEQVSGAAAYKGADLGEHRRPQPRIERSIIDVADQLREPLDFGYRRGHPEAAPGRAE